MSYKLETPQLGNLSDQPKTKLVLFWLFCSIPDAAGGFLTFRTGQQPWEVTDGVPEPPQGPAYTLGRVEMSLG